MSTTEATHEGMVKWFDPKKGFGFIEENVNGEVRDLFVHHSDINMGGYRTLQNGESVKYTVEKSEKGFVAKTVERINASVEA